MPLCLVGEVILANKPDEQPYEAPTETIRLLRDIVEMAREICLHTRVGGKKLKMTSYIDGLVREQILRDHAAVRARLLAGESGDKKKKTPKKKPANEQEG